ncbi:hypothetical protein RclHR1_10820015 [Rhizophagus clarus]|uniref:RNase H type-1 domain-containing protein n=1 Tax=Rhizophagus clarus TaxID=94130 RepID=A0A2Z6QER9_9GLOM|nr:hypothetical protein RclHR1_10820015 [Rhizophagus clarus]
MLIQYRFLIPISPLMVDDWSLWSTLGFFKQDYITCTIASMVPTPFQFQHACYVNLPDITLPGHTSLFLCMSLRDFKDSLKVLWQRHLFYLSQLITPTGSHFVFWSAYRSMHLAQLSDKCERALPHKWYLDIRAATTIPDSNDQLLDQYNTTEIISSHSWADLSNFVTSYHHHLAISPDFFLSHSTVDCPSAEVFFPPRLSHLPAPVVLAPKDGAANKQLRNNCDLRTIWDWPSSFCAEVTAIFAALVVTPTDSTVSIYTDSQTAIDGLRLCASSSYTNSRLYYKTSNFELWASIERFIRGKQLTVLPVKFSFLFHDSDDYVIDWELTWFTLQFSPVYDASFTAQHASQHYTFKFKLFLDDLLLLEKLKITCPDLYIDLLTCCSCYDHKEDLMHLILYSKRRSATHQILQSYQNYLFSKLKEACELIKVDPTPSLTKLSSLSC